MKHLIDALKEKQKLHSDDLAKLIECSDPSIMDDLFETADAVRKNFYGNAVFLRGLIEFSNICKNDCYYCGIRKSNHNLTRYRLSKEDILSCCDNGYQLGFRTFVLQGGEDGAYTDADFCSIISAIKDKHPDCAITLSLGEKSYESYRSFFIAGADRYLLRHETAGKEHYQKLHPAEMKFENRRQCLQQLKDIGYQVGAGFMVDSPYQTTSDLLSDLAFLQELRPSMIGIGPFLPHKDTPFHSFEKGDLYKCLRLIAILRLMFPYALIPSTTAMGTLHPQGRELGLRAGANVVMPNLSPTSSRELYQLYDNKICTGEEAAECRGCLERRVQTAGYEIKIDRGDPVPA